MKFTYNWLKDYLKTDKTPREIADKLSLIGLEIEELIDPNALLKPFVVGEIIEVANHPDADKLHVLKVQAGDDIYQIVCGAPNVKVGLKSVLARVGDEIPLYKEKLKASKIRGIDSQGMLCSEKELLISENHDGIIQLPKTAKSGETIEKYFKTDAIFDGEITSNRSDYLGVNGIARDLCAGGFGEFIEAKIPEIKNDFTTNINIKLSANETCPYFTAVVIRDLKNVVSPEKIVSRLKAIGINPKSFLIDITNYETFDKCRPMHAFDLDKLSGDIEIRYAKAGEKFIGLDEKEYTLFDTDCVVADANGIQLLSGIMGAKNSGCDINTKNILLVCETLIPTEIRRTSSALKIESDAKYRFERGVNPDSALSGLKVAIDEIVKNCGGKLSNVVELGKPYKETREIKYNLSFFKKLIGIEIEKQIALKIITDLGCTTKEQGDDIIITPPSYRQDLNEIHDITEELIRIYGYDKLVPMELPMTAVLRAILNPRQINELKIKRALCGMSLYETLSWSFVSSQKQNLLLGENGVEISNPIANDLDVLQKTLLINLLNSVANNQAKGNFNLPLYRVGPVFYDAVAGAQELITCGILSGKTCEKSWRHIDRNYDVFDAKEKLFSLLSLFNLQESVKITTNNVPTYAHPKRFARIQLGNVELGSYGQIHPYILKKFDIKGDVVFFELKHEKLPIKEKKQTAISELKIPELQSLSRDFAFIAPFDFASNDLIVSVKNVDKLITEVSLFDDYDMQDGTKSLAINVIIQPFEKSLTDAEIDEISQKIILVANKLGLKLR